MDSALQTMTTNVNVGIDEVVAIFVSRYETNLYAKKDTLSANIKSLKQEIADIERNLIESVDKSQYEGRIDQIGVFSKVDSVSVTFEAHMSHCKVGIHVGVGLHDDKETRHYALHTKTIVLPIDENVIKQRKELMATLEEKNAELLEVMGLIKTVGRKERQVRGRIAEMKLEQAGQQELLANTELTKLISMS